MAGTNFGAGVAHGAGFGKADVGASATDTVVVTAGSATQRVRVLGLAVSCGATPSTVVLNSKGAGAGTAISQIFNNSIVLPPIRPGKGFGWFETNPGEGLSASTGSGSTSGVSVIYELVG